MPASPSESVADAAPAPGAWAPLGDPLFRALWIATLVSNVGTWMHDVGAGWLMTSLAPSPVMVALVQTATSLPVFLLALPAGALADIVDRRRYLLVVQAWMLAVAALLAFCAFSGVMTSWLLVLLTFGMGLGTAMMMPAWAAVTPEVVPRSLLQPAIALNSMGINVSRAIGPALAGLVITSFGTSAVFALNAVSFLGVIFVLQRWRRDVPESDLPAERFAGALRAGLRFARHAPSLHAAMVRGAAFFLFASASWALLPLVARQLEDGGPQAFGLLVAAIGAGAVFGAVQLPRLRRLVSKDVLVRSATLLYALAMVALALIDHLAPLLLAMFAAGMAWIAVLSSLQVSSQMALPSWVRSRGLACFMTVFMGSMAGGSLLWGRLAQLWGLDAALLTAAVGAALAVLLAWRWRLDGIDDVDLTPSMHWPAPPVAEHVVQDRGPVLVTIDYRVPAPRRAEFLALLRELGERRRRDGAFTWSVHQHTEDDARFIESFGTESWLDHLRQHERVSEAERDLQARIRALLEPGTSPVVEHFVAPA